MVRKTIEKFNKISTLRKVLFIISSVLTLFILWFIFSHSAKNATDSSGDSQGLSNFVAEFINQILGTSLTNEDTVGYVRTFAHIAEFSALSYMFSASYESLLQKYKAPFTVSIPFTAAVAVADETVQIFFEGRAFQISDIICDTFGGVLGCICLYITLKIVYRKTKGKKT